MYKICLDAGHYGKYNRSPANKNYYESEVMWKLTMMQKKYLEDYGFEVILTRDDINVNTDLEKRGKMSKGCALFLSNHSNAVGSDVNESVDYPTAYVTLDGKADDIAKKLTDCIKNVMKTKQNGMLQTRKSKNGGEYYGVLRGAVAVGTTALILEHSFHTNTNATNWLLNDENLERLARSEAVVIADWLGVEAEDVDTLTGYVTIIYDGADGLNIRRDPSFSDNIMEVTHGGSYEVVGMTTNKNWFKLKNGGYITSSGKYVTFSASCPQFSVRVTIDNLNIRKGPGTDYEKNGYTGKGTFTIIDIKAGKGSDAGWGRLKSGAGWISLDFAERI